MPMSRGALAIFVSIVGLPLLGQSLQDQLAKAPPEVDKRLRERITAFYQAHVDHKFRQAEGYVAPDTKDFFYEQHKAQVLKFEIKNVEYSDNFTRAKATVICHQRIMMPGFNGQVVGVPVPSYWKIENGDWYFFVADQQRYATPFGTMKPSEGGGSGEMPNLSSGPDVRALQSMVKAEKDRIELAPGRESQEVKILSAMPGTITLQLIAPPDPGLTASLEKTEVPAKGSTVLRVSIDPKKPLTKTVVVRVVVQQTGKALDFVVSYKGA